jgi:hypothetical protein
MRSATLLALGAALLSACLGPAVGKGPKAEAGYRAATPIIEALDRFHADQGHYPARLAELVPKYVRDRASLQFSYGSALPNPSDRFSYTRVDDSYTLGFTYVGPGINHCWYDSRTKKWESDGYY